MSRGILSRGILSRGILPRGILSWGHIVSGHIVAGHNVSGHNVLGHFVSGHIVSGQIFSHKMFWGIFSRDLMSSQSPGLFHASSFDPSTIMNLYQVWLWNSVRESCLHIQLWGLPLQSWCYNLCDLNIERGFIYILIRLAKKMKKLLKR